MSEQDVPGPGTASGAYSATTDGRRGTPDAVVDALGDVSERVRGLVQEEIELVKAELRAKLRTLVAGLVAAAAAAAFVLGALVLILHGFAWLAYWAIPFPNGQYFWGFFVVAAILLLLGALAGFLASRAIKRATPPAPTMAIDEAKLIKETVTSPDPASTVPAATTTPEARP